MSRTRYVPIGRRMPRRPRRGRTWDAGPDCRVCGMKAINVVHQMDPANSAEGPEYHSTFAHHPFEATQ